MLENDDKSLAGIEGSVSDDENFISISSDDDADYAATINIVNEYLNNFSNANVEVGSSSTSVNKVQGYEDDYVSDYSDDNMASSSAPAPPVPPVPPTPPVQDYIGKGKQRADPIPENLTFHNNAIQYDNQEMQTPQSQNTDTIMTDKNISSSIPNKITIDRNVALFPSQPPNFPDWITRDIMIPCPLSETQRTLISNLILDQKLIQYLSEVSSHENADANSLIRIKIRDVLRILDHEPVEAINGHLFNGPSNKSLHYNGSEMKSSVEKLKMLRCILTELRSLRLVIGIAASSGLSTDAIIRFMGRIRQPYYIINDESSEYNKKFYQEREKLSSSFCVIFSTDFINYHKNVLPKLDFVIAYDITFKPNQHFYFSMGNLSIPVLRLVTCDTLEHVIVYGMIHKCSFINDSSVETFKNILFYGLKSISKQYRIVMGRDSSSFPYAHICTSIFTCAKSNAWDRLERTIREFINLNINKWFENNKPTTGVTLESIWNYRENGEITASTLAECNINLSDSSDDEVEEKLEEKLESNVKKQRAKRPIVEVGSSCKKRSRSTRNELAPALSEASSEVKKLKELIKQKDDIIKQLQETNSKLVLENSQLRQQHLMFNQQSFNQSIINKSEKKNGNIINGDVIMSSSSPNIVSYQSHVAPTENFPDQFSCQLQNCNKRFDSEKKLLVHQRTGHHNNEVIILD